LWQTDTENPFFVRNPSRILEKVKSSSITKMRAIIGAKIKKKAGIFPSFLF